MTVSKSRMRILLTQIYVLYCQDRQKSVESYIEESLTTDGLWQMLIDAYILYKLLNVFVFKSPVCFYKTLYLFLLMVFDGRVSSLIRLRPDSRFIT